jgi:predicted RNase H-like nuclease (RuvC/YqgF family)
MSSQPEARTTVSKAATAFREAFDRLKQNRPETLAKGSAVSQNNVAKKAGCDASALRKSRYPALVAEIQRWLETNRPEAPLSQRQTLLSQRKRNRSLKQRIEDMKAQRDSLASLLVEADAKILELTLENARLRAEVPSSKVTPIHQGR